MHKLQVTKVTSQATRKYGVCVANVRFYVQLHNISVCTMQKKQKQIQQKHTHIHAKP